MLQKLLSHIVGPDPKVHTHLCNDNERPGGKKGSAARAGRWWLTSRRPKQRDRELALSWHFWDRHYNWIFPGWRLHFSDGGGDRDLSLSFHGLTCYFSVTVGGVVGDKFRETLGLYKPPRPGEQYGHFQSREMGIDFHDGTCWVDLWGKQNSWSREDPKWQRFNFSVDPRNLFGKLKYASETVKSERVEIPLPEGTYPATVEIHLDSWTRKRFPWWPLSKAILRAHVKMDKPIPYPGKGENSWDCNEDGLYGSTSPANTVEEAIGHIVGDVLTTRRRRGVGHNYTSKKAVA